MASTNPLANNILRNVIQRENGLSSSCSFQSKLFADRLSISKNLFKRDLVSHYGCINAIEFSREGNWLISGGDDRRVLLWNLHKSMLNIEEPNAMLKQHLSNIFCLSFDSKNTRVYSGGNDDMAIIHDITSGDCIDVFYHTKPIYGLGVDPFNDNIFATAGEDGRVLLFDLRASNAEPKTIVKYRAPFHAVQFHPIDNNFMITANAKEGAALWDNRSQRMPIIRYGGEDASQSCMSVRFNANGTLLLALRRRLPPILYSTIDHEPICQFYNQDYYNSCTMKSCTFAGPFDEYVLSGSDDFNLYVWRVNDADLESRHQWVDKNQIVLYGHRSIVNQVRYNPQRCLLASSGVEKIIKLWTPFELDQWTGSLTETQIDNVREVFTHEEYISLVHSNGQNMTHDYSNQNTNEDPRMIAFFDYLVQQEIEGWSSESSNQSSDHTSENSSRPDSPTSDTERDTAVNIQTVKTVVNRNHTLRRGEASHRHKYRNRIAFLIATKRKSLKRLALKRCARNINSRRLKNKYIPRQSKRASNLRSVNRKPYDKKTRRLSVQSKYKHVSREQTSDSEVPIKRRRNRSHTGNLSYRAFRRKAKTPLSSAASNTSTRVADKSDSSSDYDDNINLVNNINNSNDIRDTNPSIPIPSTSTGITANGKNFIFRFASAPNNTYDSDDDQSLPDTNQSINNHLLRFNNNHNHSNNSAINSNSNNLEYNDGASTSTHRSFLNSSQKSHYNNHSHEIGRRKKYKTHESEHDFEDYVSTNNSNSLLSSTESSSNDSYHEYFNAKKRRLNSQTSNGEASTNNIFETPPIKKTTDSGIADETMTPNTSNSRENARNSMNDVITKFDDVKRNYRKNMITSDDSD
ncbi:hypothetical protein ACKWTF_009929 [Chironomus riparius]